MRRSLDALMQRGEQRKANPGGAGAKGSRKVVVVLNKQGQPGATGVAGGECVEAPSQESEGRRAATRCGSKARVASKRGRPPPSAGAKLGRQGWAAERVVTPFKLFLRVLQQSLHGNSGSAKGALLAAGAKGALAGSRCQARLAGSRKQGTDSAAEEPAAPRRAGKQGGGKRGRGSGRGRSVRTVRKVRVTLAPGREQQAAGLGQHMGARQPATFRRQTCAYLLASMLATAISAHRARSQHQIVSYHLRPGCFILLAARSFHITCGQIQKRLRSLGARSRAGEAHEVAAQQLTHHLRGVFECVRCVSALLAWAACVCRCMGACGHMQAAGTCLSAAMRPAHA